MSTRYRRKILKVNEQETCGRLKRNKDAKGGWIAFHCDKLQDRIKEACSTTSGIFLIFIPFIVYFALSLTSIKDIDVLLGKTVKLPLLDISLSFSGYFFIAPVLALAFHVYVLIHFYIIAIKIKIFYINLQCQLEKVGAHELQAYSPLLLFVYSFIQDEKERFRFLNYIIVVLTLYALPVFSFAYAYYIAGIYDDFSYIVFSIIILFLDVCAVCIFNAKVFSETLKPFNKNSTVIDEKIKRYCSGKSSIKEFLQQDLPIYKYILRTRFNKGLALATVISMLCILSQSTWLVAEKISPALVPQWLAERTRIDVAGLDIGKRLGEGRSPAEYFTLQGRNFINADLRGTKFGAVDFSECDLQNANFSYATMKQPKFTLSNLEGCDFTHADMNGGRFDLCNLAGADFSYADLPFSNFSGSFLYGTRFINSKMAGANFSVAQAPCDIANKADLARKMNGNLKSLKGAHNAIVKQFNEKLARADNIPSKMFDYKKFKFYEAVSTAYGGHFTPPDPDQVESYPTIAYFCNFHGADLRLSHFLYACLKGSLFSHSDLAFSYFDNCDIDISSFRSTNLQGAYFLPYNNAFLEIKTIPLFDFTNASFLSPDDESRVTSSLIHFTVPKSFPELFIAYLEGLQSEGKPFVLLSQLGLNSDLKEELITLLSDHQYRVEKSISKINSFLHRNKVRFSINNAFKIHPSEKALSDLQRMSDINYPQMGYYYFTYPDIARSYMTCNTDETAASRDKGAMPPPTNGSNGKSFSYGYLPCIPDVLLPHEAFMFAYYASNTPDEVFKASPREGGRTDYFCKAYNAFAQLSQNELLEFAQLISRERNEILSSDNRTPASDSAKEIFDKIVTTFSYADIERILLSYYISNYGLQYCSFPSLKNPASDRLFSLINSKSPQSGNPAQAASNMESDSPELPGRSLQESFPSTAFSLAVQGLLELTSDKKFHLDDRIKQDALASNKTIANFISVNAMDSLNQIEADSSALQKASISDELADLSFQKKFHKAVLSLYNDYPHSSETITSYIQFLFNTTNTEPTLSFGNKFKEESVESRDIQAFYYLSLQAFSKAMSGEQSHYLVDMMLDYFEDPNQFYYDAQYRFDLSKLYFMFFEHNAEELGIVKRVASLKPRFKRSFDFLDAPITIPTCKRPKTTHLRHPIPSGGNNGQIR